MTMTRHRRLAFLLLASTALAALAAVVLRAGSGVPSTGAAISAEAPGVTASPWHAPAEIRPATLIYDRFETLTVADGLPSNRVTSVLAVDDELWVGTDRGLARRRGGEWAYWSEAEGLSHRYVTSLAQDRRTGDLWISTLGGLSRLSGGKLETYTQLDSGLMNDVVYHVVADRGQVWAATAAGASHLDTTTGSWALYDHENSIMREPWCYALAVGAGHIWIGVWGGGVVELDQATAQWKEYRDPDGEMEILLLRDDGPIHDVTSFVAWEAGVLWQATYFGLSRFDGLRWRTFRREDSGLPGDFINHVSARGHAAFLGTDEGFGVTDGETVVSYRRTADGKGERTLYRNGEAIETVLLPTAPADNYVLWTHAGEDEVWLATGSGLSRGLRQDGGPGPPPTQRPHGH
jgi:ligand-binding sensor domain-containing protein